MGFNVIGSGLKTLANPSSAVTLQSGQYAVLPGGQYLVQLGKYSALQWYDPISTTWRNFNAITAGSIVPFTSDGYNYRIMNLSGTVVGGVVTTGGTSNAAKNGIWLAGSSSTTGATATVAAPANAPTQTAQMNVIVGGAIQQTITVTAGGSGYVIPPIISFSPPPAGGLLPTAYAVLTAGAVSSVTVVDQGAGYTSAPTITVTPVFGDPGVGAVLTPALVTSTTGGYGQAVAVTMSNYGGGYATVPTITCAGLTSMAVTAVTCLSVITATTVTAASGGANGSQLTYVAQPTAATLFGSMKNPSYTTNLFSMRNGLGGYNTSATYASQTILDGGLSQLDVSNLATFTLASTGTVPAATTFASGASGGVASDISYVIPL